MRITFPLLLFCLTACNVAPPPPVEVTGAVLQDGKAMSDGFIYFQPNDAKPPIREKIEAGRYSLKCAPGEYRVGIQQERDTGKKNMYGEPQMDSTIKAAYNTETTLTAKVKQEGPNVFDFKVESK